MLDCYVSLCSGTAAIYLPLKIALATKIIHHTEAQNLTALHISPLHQEPLLPSIFHPAPQLGTNNAHTSLQVKTEHHYSEMAHWQQKQVLALTASPMPSLYNTGNSHPSDSPDDVFTYGLLTARKRSFAPLSTLQHSVCYK